MQYVVAGVGYTGRRVCTLLSDFEPVGINRSPLRSPPKGTTIVPVDLDEAEPDLIPVQSLCTILYTIPPAGGGAVDERLGRFLSMLKAEVSRVVYLSTSGVYGNRGGERVFEKDVPLPETERAIRRLAAEDRLQRWVANTRTELVILRVPGIYGPGRLGIDRINAGESLIREAECIPGNRIHVDDLASCCVRAMTASIPSGVYNVGDGDHRSSTWFSQSVAAMLKLPRIPEVSRARAAETFSDLRLSFLAESRIVDTTKMRKVMGFTPGYTDPIDGIRASLARCPE